MTDDSYYGARMGKWEGKITDFAERISSDGVDVETVEQELHDVIAVAADLSCDEWEPGDPCPSCDDDGVFRWVSFPEIVRHESGYTSIEVSGDDSTVFAWDCDSCGEILAVSPAALFLSATDVTPPSNIDTLQGVFTSMNNTDWEWGTACSDCGCHFISEYPISIEQVTDEDGENGFHTTAERLTTVKYSCDSCSEHLHQTHAGVLMDTFTLSL